MINSGFSFDEYYQNSTISLQQQMNQQKLPPIFSKPKPKTSSENPSEQNSKSNSKCSGLSLSPIKPDCTYTKLIKQKRNLVAVKTDTNRTWLVWSVINVIIFLPLVMLWLPALVFSLKARKKLSEKRYETYCVMANRSLTFNILTVAVGLVGYMIALTLIINLIPAAGPGMMDSATILDRDSILCRQNQCFEYCRLENSAFWYMGIIYSQYWTCYSNYNDYFTYQHGIRLLYCIQKQSSMYICSNDASFANRMSYVRVDLNATEAD